MSPHSAGRAKRRLVIGTAVVSLAATVSGSALAAVGGPTSKDRTAEVKAAIHGGKARNVIMFLGDGMGDSEITVARNYHAGAAGHLNMDSLPLTGEYTTYAVKKGSRTTPDYVTDSAASGTGWSTGHKTYNNAISVDPVTLKPLATVLEKAQAAGYATGNVTTAELTDATPAVLDSHISQRGCQGPADMAACPGEAKPNGLGSIAEQTVDHGVDVLMGGGKARFDQPTVYGATETQLAAAKGYQVVTDATGLAGVNYKKPVLGLFAPVNMDLEWAGPLAAPYPGPAAASCDENNPARPASQPHLVDMTKKAISLLDKKSSGKKKGFFLQVEGASIDKQDHASNPCGQIGETVQFDAAIAAARTWAKSHPDTLIIVTADHGHTSQIIDPPTAADHSPGSIATLITKDGQPMTVNYGTNLAGRSQSHTGTEVRIAAQGPQAANVVGITDQTDLFHTMSRALGFEK